MERSGKPEYNYHKVFLYPQGIHPVGNEPGGTVALFKQGQFWELAGEAHGGTRGIVKGYLSLFAETFDGENLLLGKIRPGEKGEDAFTLKTKMTNLPDKGFRIHLCVKTGSGKKARWTPLLSGVLNYDNGATKTPGDYLWNPAIMGDFPQLLEKVLEKVEAITEKVNTLEQLRAQKQQQQQRYIRQQRYGEQSMMPQRQKQRIPAEPEEALPKEEQTSPVIRRVEPFRPPLPNYKWWQLGC